MDFSATAGARYGWCRRVGYAAIEKIRVTVGNIYVDTQFSLWINAWHELARKPGQAADKAIDDMMFQLSPV